MSRRACKRVSFSPNPEATYDESIFPKHDGLSSPHHDRIKVILVGVFSFGLRSSPAARKLLKRIGVRVDKTLRIISFRKDNNNLNTDKTSSLLSSSSVYMKRSKSLTESESHRAEAIEDCIEFLKSSSLSRSNSVLT